MRWAFGDFELDQEGQRLMHFDRELQLEPKAFDLLCYMAAHAGRVISKDELLERVWRVQVLSDGVLSNTVAKLRKALGQGARSGRPIETLHGRGYRFHAEVRTLRASVQVTDPFVGRAGVMKELSQCLEKARQGRGQLVLIEGEPGIGKSRVLDELMQVAAERGWSNWLGTSYPDAAAPVYWPWVEILRAAQSSGASMFQQDLPKDAWALSQLVPELLAAAAPGQQVHDVHALRFRLFDELTRFLAAAAARTPRLIAIEDLHWADAGSIELLAHVSRAMLAQPVVLLATVRGHAAVSDTPHSAALARLSRLATTITLDGLSEPEVSELVSALCASEPAAPGCAQVLHARTQGHPLFVRQLLQLFLQHGQRLEPQQLMAAQLPPGVRDVVKERLLGLPRSTRQLLSAAAVIGQQFDAALLSKVVSADLTAVVDRLAPALQLGLVRITGPTPYRFGFAHSLWCDSLYDELPLPERGAIHARLLQLLAAQVLTADARRLSEIARHSLHALPSQLSACIEHCQRAADAAREASSFESAAELQQRALDKLAAEGGEPRLRCELLSRLGLNLFCSGDLDGGFESLTQSARLAQQIGAPDLLAQAAQRLTDWLIVGGDRSQVRGYVAGALAALDATDHAEQRAVLLARQAELSVDLPRAERMQLYAQADALAQPLSASVRFEVALARVGMRDITQLEHSRCAAQSCRRLVHDHPAELAGMRARLGLCVVAFSEYMCALTLADMAATERAFVQLQQSVQAAHVQPLTLAFEMVVAGRAHAQDRHADLRAAIERMHAQNARPGGMGIGALYYEALTIEGWRELHPHSLAENAPRLGLTPLQLIAALAWRASCAARAGQHDIARNALDSIRAEDLVLLPVQWGDLGVLCWLAEAAAALQDHERMQLIYAQLAPYSGRNAVGIAFDYMGCVDHYLALIEVAQGQPDQAVAHLQQAALMNRRLRMPQQLQRTQALLACAERV